MVHTETESEDTSQDSGLLAGVAAQIPFEALKQRVEIASGTFGTVLKAQMYGTEVAVKRNFKSRDHNVEKYLKREVSALQAMHHPNIVQFLGISTDPSSDELYIVTEFVDGGNMAELIDNHAHAFSWRRVVSYAKDVAAAMTYLHAQSVIHRDLKAANLLLEKAADRVKVCDFGLSRRQDKGGLAQMTLCGTDDYMAPEVIMGEEYNEKADVFSYGIVLYELVTRLPPAERAPKDQFRFDSDEFHQSCPPSVPPLLAQVVVDACNFEPEMRTRFTDIIESLDMVRGDSSCTDDPIRLAFGPDAAAAASLPEAEVRSTKVESPVRVERFETRSRRGTELGGSLLLPGGAGDPGDAGDASKKFSGVGAHRENGEGGVADPSAMDELAALLSDDNGQLTLRMMNKNSSSRKKKSIPAEFTGKDDGASEAASKDRPKKNKKGKSGKRAKKEKSSPESASDPSGASAGTDLDIKDADGASDMLWEALTNTDATEDETLDRVNRVLESLLARIGEGASDVIKESVNTPLDPESALTMLHAAAAQKFPRVVGVLRDAGGRMKAQVAPHRFYPIHTACEVGSSEVVAELLKSSIGRGTLELTNMASETPLMVAMRHAHWDTAAVLLDERASVSTYDAAGRSPLWHLARKGRGSPVARELVPRVLDAGGEVDRADNEGKTPLFHAISQGDDYMAGILCERGADLMRYSRYLFAKSAQAKTLHTRLIDDLKVHDAGRVKQTLRLGAQRSFLPDNESSKCLGCSADFTPIRRRHHCRVCGLLMCDDCTKKRIAVPKLGFDAPVRVCKKCVGVIRKEAKVEKKKGKTKK